MKDSRDVEIATAEDGIYMPTHSSTTDEGVLCTAINLWLIVVH
jgi:hypothetical protein